MSMLTDSIAAARALYEAHFPMLGLADEVYLRRAKRAEQANDPAGRACNKVGLCLTHAQSASLRWDAKRDLFERALFHYCRPSDGASDEVRAYFKALSDFVCEVAGLEALRHAVAKDDHLAARKAAGVPGDEIATEAEGFFDDLLGYRSGYAGRPPLFREAEYAQLVMIRNQWV